MEVTLYDVLTAVGEVKEVLDSTETADLTEIENLLGDTNEYLSDISDNLTDLNITVDNTFNIIGAVFVLLCIGAIIVTLVKTFFSGW